MSKHVIHFSLKKDTLFKLCSINDITIWPRGITITVYQSTISSTTTSKNVSFTVQIKSLKNKVILLTNLTGGLTLAAFSHSTKSLEKKSVPVVGLLSSYFIVSDGSYAPTPVTNTKTLGFLLVWLIAFANDFVV